MPICVGRTKKKANQECKLDLKSIKCDKIKHAHKTPITGRGVNCVVIVCRLKGYSELHVLAPYNSSLYAMTECC